VPDARALVRLQADHVNRTLVPAFYRFLQAQEVDAQIEGGKDFFAALEQLTTLLERAEHEAEGGDVAGLGLWVDGGELGWTDVMVGPCECLSLVCEGARALLSTLQGCSARLMYYDTTVGLSSLRASDSASGLIGCSNILLSKRRAVTSSCIWIATKGEDLISYCRRPPLTLLCFMQICIQPPKC
jgi:hypothetical protein